MGIKVRARLCGNSLAITLPRQITRLHNINKGDDRGISPLVHGEITIKKK